MINSAERVTLHSALPVETCLRRLTQEVDENSWNPFSGSKSVIGDTTAQTFRLWRRTDWLTGPYGTHYRGWLIEDRGGTKIEGEWKVATWRANYFRLGFGIAVVIAAAFTGTIFIDLVTGRHQEATLGPEWLYLFLPWAFPFVFWVAWRAAQEFEQNGKRRLLEFLQEVLSAQPENQR